MSSPFLCCWQTKNRCPMQTQHPKFAVGATCVSPADDAPHEKRTVGRWLAAAESAEMVMAAPRDRPTANLKSMRIRRNRSINRIGSAVLLYSYYNVCHGVSSSGAGGFSLPRGPGRASFTPKSSLMSHSTNASTRIGMMHDVTMKTAMDSTKRLMICAP